MVIVLGDTAPRRGPLGEREPSLERRAQDRQARQYYFDECMRGRG